MDSVESQAEALAGDKIPKMSSADLKTPEDNQIPVSSQGMASDLDNLAGSVSGSLKSILPKVLEAEKEKGEATKTEALGEVELEKNYQKQLREKYENFPAGPNVQPPPPLPEDDPLRNFGSLASMIGIFASAFTKKPIVNALNASADAMNAERSGNKEAYDLAHQQWKDQTELAFKRHESEIKDLHEIMDIMEKNHAAGFAELKAWAIVNGSKAATFLAEAADVEEVGKWVSSQQNALAKAKEASTKIEELNLKKQGAVQEAALKTAQAGLANTRADILKAGGGITSGQKIKLEEKIQSQGDALDDIDDAIGIMDSSFAIAGIPGSVRNYAEPLSNIFGSSATAEKDFKARISELKERLPALLRGSNKSLKADYDFLNDIIGGTGFGNSTASTYSRLTKIQERIMKDRKGTEDMLNPNTHPSVDHEEPDEQENQGTGSWEDAPVISPSEE